MNQDDKKTKLIASNRKASHDYHVLERIEAGVCLVGTEVKSVRAGGVSLAGSYARVDGTRVTLQHVTIQPYEFGNRNNHEPDRPRQLLLNKREIDKLRAATEQKGATLVPLRLYMRNGRVKVELGLCRGKNQGDKRETLRRKTVQRETDREIARHR